MLQKSSTFASLTKIRDRFSISIPLQLLSEEIYYNKLDLVSLCYQLDKAVSSAIDPVMFKALIAKYCPSFSEHELKELIDLAPKADNGHILYRELSFSIEVFICAT